MASSVSSFRPLAFSGFSLWPSFGLDEESDLVRQSLDVAFELRIHAKPRPLRRTHLVGGFLLAPAHCVQRRQVVVRFAQPAVHGRGRLPLFLGGWQLTVAEMRASEDRKSTRLN